MRYNFLGIVVGIVVGVGLQRGALPLALVALALAGMAALNLLQASLWPARVEAVRRELEQRLLRNTLLGLLAVLCVVFVVLNLQPPLRGLSVLLAVLALLGLALGGAPAALAALLGRRVAPEESQPRQLLLGTAMGGLALLVPVLGWATALGLALAGLGASLVTLA